MSAWRVFRTYAVTLCVTSHEQIWTYARDTALWAASAYVAEGPNCAKLRSQQGFVPFGEEVWVGNTTWHLDERSPSSAWRLLSYCRARPTFRYWTGSITRTTIHISPIRWPVTCHILLQTMSHRSVITTSVEQQRRQITTSMAPPVITIPEGQLITSMAMRASYFLPPRLSSWRFVRSRRCVARLPHRR
jgi:hypothetical protein